MELGTTCIGVNRSIAPPQLFHLTHLGLAWTSPHSKPLVNEASSFKLCFKLCSHVEAITYGM